MDHSHSNGLVFNVVEVGHPDVVTLGGIVPGQPVTGDIILRVCPRDA